jgi:hypothetical protein
LRDKKRLQKRFLSLKNPTHFAAGKTHGYFGSEKVARFSRLQLFKLTTIPKSV